MQRKMIWLLQPCCFCFWGHRAGALPHFHPTSRFKSVHQKIALQTWLFTRKSKIARVQTLWSCCEKISFLIDRFFFLSPNAAVLELFLASSTSEAGTISRAIRHNFPTSNPPPAGAPYNRPRVEQIYLNIDSIDTDAGIGIRLISNWP